MAQLSGSLLNLLLLQFILIPVCRRRRTHSSAGHSQMTHNWNQENSRGNVWSQLLAVMSQTIVRIRRVCVGEIVISCLAVRVRCLQPISVPASRHGVLLASAMSQVLPVLPRSSAPLLSLRVLIIIVSVPETSVVRLWLVLLPQSSVVTSSDAACPKRSVNLSPLAPVHDTHHYSVLMALPVLQHIRSVLSHPAVPMEKCGVRMVCVEIRLMSV